MATDQQLIEQARNIQDVSDMMTTLAARSDGVVKLNQNLGIDWNSVASTNPDALDENGNIQGTSSSPQDVSNAVGALDNFSTAHYATNRVNYDNVRSVQINKAWR